MFHLRIQKVNLLVRIVLIFHHLIKMRNFVSIFLHHAKMNEIISVF